MKLELLVFGTTAGLLYNAYYDGKLFKQLMTYKKHANMLLIGVGAICLYLMLKRNPSQSKQLLYYTNNMVKALPFDRTTSHLLSPVFDLSSQGRQFMHELNDGKSDGWPSASSTYTASASFPWKPTKRSVSETKKKYVASLQNWKCGQCQRQLTHTFEVDHKLRLEHGGTNDPNNLVALCRECHGAKTAMENM